MKARVGRGRRNGDDVEGRRITDASSGSGVPGPGQNPPFTIHRLSAISGVGSAVIGHSVAEDQRSLAAEVVVRLALGKRPSALGKPPLRKSRSA